MEWTDRDGPPEARPEYPTDRTRTYYRTVLQYLRDQSTGVATVDELVAFVRDRDRFDADESRVAIRLHHVTLPKLADAGYIEYDARSNTARYRDRQLEIQ